MKIILAIFGVILFTNLYSQSCEMYEIKNIPVYFSVVVGEKSVSKINDSLSFSIFTNDNQNYIVEKLINGAIIDTRQYIYKGKKRCQFFTIKKRKIDEVSMVKQRKIICLLE